MLEVLRRYFVGTYAVQKGTAKGTEVTKFHGKAHALHTTMQPRMQQSTSSRSERRGNTRPTPPQDRR